MSRTRSINELSYSSSSSSSQNPRVLPCGACRYLRKRCSCRCKFAPYFDYSESEKFEKICKVYGAQNLARLLSTLHPDDRAQAVFCYHYEAQERLKNPVYGCVSKIFLLEEQVKNLEFQVTSLKEQLSALLPPHLPESTSFVSTTPLPELPCPLQDPSSSVPNLGDISSVPVVEPTISAPSPDDDDNIFGNLQNLLLMDIDENTP